VGQGSSDHLEIINRKEGAKERRNQGRRRRKKNEEKKRKIFKPD